eukprot:scaffold3531_cov183-Cylindrotheca_fusiformis.AAC.2
MYDAVKSRVDPDLFRMGDKAGNMVAMDGIPETYNECIDKFNLQVAKKGTHQHLMFVFMIQSTRPPLSMIKNTCFHVLKQHNLYLHSHPFSLEKLDVGSVGFILGANARYHSPEKQRFRMKMAIERWWRELDDGGGKALWKNRFKSTKDGPDVIPDFFITAKSVQARDSLGRELASASALLVMTPLEHIQAMSTLLEEVFAPDDKDEDNPGIRRDIAAERPIRFVPSRFQRGPESDVYVKLAGEATGTVHP